MIYMPFPLKIRCLKKMRNPPTDGPIDGRTDPHIDASKNKLNCLCFFFGLQNGPTNRQTTTKKRYIEREIVSYCLVCADSFGMIIIYQNLKGIYYDFYLRFACSQKSYSFSHVLNYGKTNIQLLGMSSSALYHFQTGFSSITKMDFHED